MFLASVICYAIHPILCCFAVVGLFYCSGIEPIRKGVQQTQEVTLIWGKLTVITPHHKKHCVKKHPS